jgi:hypothetical protein
VSENKKWVIAWSAEAGAGSHETVLLSVYCQVREAIMGKQGALVVTGWDG